MANSLKLYVDPNNANPSRLSRLPNSMRFNSRQELYALNVGAKTWQDFEAEIQAEAVGQEFEVANLMKFDTENDPNNLLGQRWLMMKWVIGQKVNYPRFVGIEEKVDELNAELNEQKTLMRDSMKYTRNLIEVISDQSSESDSEAIDFEEIRRKYGPASSPSA
tara:strand:- start:702 stop:1190 length:489 start_codon:yes stop_codon:yes gene_type:complete